MIFKRFNMSFFPCCFLLCSTIITAKQMVPIKSNMGQPSEIFVKRALMENLSPSATESNMYFLPIQSAINSQYNGEIYVNETTGFSISEAKRSISYSTILLTSPTGNMFSIQNDNITCVTSICPLNSVNVTINPSSGGSNPSIRTVSINDDNNIQGRWQINISNLANNVSNKDFLVTHEDAVMLALRDSDQISLINTPNKFIFELRELPRIIPVPIPDPDPTPDPDPDPDPNPDPGPFPVPFPSPIPDPGPISAPSEQTPKDGYTKISGLEIQSLDANVTVVSQSPNPLPLNFVPIGYDVVISQTGEISTTIPGLPAGNYSLEVDFTAFLTNGDVIQRTAYYGFPVISSPITLSGNSTSKVLDNNRFEVSLDVDKKDNNTKDIVLVYAEIWSDDKPVSFINTMAHVDNNSQLSLAIDSRWFALAGSTNRQKFEFKNIKLLDPDTYLIIDEMKSLKVPVSRFPDAAYSRASEVIIDDNMLYGKNDVYLPFEDAKNEIDAIRGGPANGIFLVHGWCANTTAWNQFNFNDGPTFEYTNTNSSIGRNNFAIAIRNQADAIFTDWFSVVAHSQGGQAAVHLQAYFFSGLDLSPAPRPIQTVGAPYQGSTLMDLYFFSGAGIINAIFNFSDCEPQFSLTTPGSYFWSIFLPTATQNDTFYYRTIHDTPNNFWQALQFWRWKCNFASYILGGNDDGVTRPFKSWLLFGNNMGITESQCHTGGMRYTDQKDDLGRNNIMDQMGRVTATWTAWLDRDNPSGNGDWEQRSLQTGVCANPINYQARRVGTGTPANSTGEVFFRNSPIDGLVCRNADQPDNTCFDYEVRFLCP